MILLRKKTAQTVAEYALMVAILAAAVIGMRVYFQKAVQGKVKVIADQINPFQYNPNDTISITETNATGGGSFYSDSLGSKSSGYEDTERVFSENATSDFVEE